MRDFGAGALPELGNRASPAIVMVVYTGARAVVHEMERALDGNRMGRL